MVTNIDLTFLADVTSTVEEVKVEDLTIDPEVQRPEDIHKIRRIFKRFTPAGVGTLLVSHRPDGSYIVLDGQTRTAVLKRKLVEGGPKAVWCQVYENLTTEQEAALFLTHNDSTKPRATDKFKIAAVAGDESTMGIRDIVTRHGYKILPVSGKGYISAVGALERIYRVSEVRNKEPNTLELALIILERAYHYDPLSTKGAIIEGVAAVIEEYGDKLNVAELVEKMRGIPEGPVGLLSEAVSWSRIQKLNLPMAVAAVLVFTYNKGRNSDRKKLREWGRKHYISPRK